MTNPVKVRLLVLTVFIAQTAHPAERFSADMSFFEYLGAMVEDDGTLIDPMDIDPLTQLDSVASESQPAAIEIVEESEKNRASAKPEEPAHDHLTDDLLTDDQLSDDQLSEEVLPR